MERRGVNSTLSKASLVGVIYTLLSSPSADRTTRAERGFEWATIRARKEPKNVGKSPFKLFHSNLKLGMKRNEILTPF